uniref:Uncharacterized protein n=1 Tax=Globodera rostochiensis TaxID=31243 RepID=A0A914I2R1_GLORO
MVGRVQHSAAFKFRKWLGVFIGPVISFRKHKFESRERVDKKLLRWEPSRLNISSKSLFLSARGTFSPPYLPSSTLIITISHTAIGSLR